MEQLQELIKPELLVLLPVLYIVGVGLKKANKIPDNYIPAILGIIGIIFAGLYIAGTTSGGNVFMKVFTAITQGLLCAGGSVYVNQIVKQVGNGTDR